MNKEKILVCVNYGQTGRRLIRRAGQLSGKLGAKLIILIIDTLADDEFVYHKEIDISVFKELAKAYEATVVIKKAKAVDLTSTIINTAKKENISQIILGQTVESVWASILGRSLIDVLLKEVTSADITVIPRERSSAQEEWEYDLGTKAFLSEEEDGTFNLQFEKDRNTKYEGVFLKSLYTEFDNGIFAFLSDNDTTMEVRVIDGKVFSLVDIDESDLN
ncbi:universal stress protein UspA [Salipaludibacillus sp. CUR1]|uniref:universal stress protein UspA n=1 Tax=Salipaludibacillus sp. CUR1 TaxID=2820003 RepID=UPI001E43DCF1|nr:universal stress protein UspA [Salipaludibacillus sp. CUR1]MCE7791734.1 universal stress protein UspA [Salipaludibacillus sp. CUR1]